VQPSVIGQLSIQSRIIAVSPFEQSVVTLQVCSEVLANGVQSEIMNKVVNAVDWQDLHHTKLAIDQSGRADPGRRNFSPPMSTAMTTLQQLRTKLRSIQL